MAQMFVKGVEDTQSAVDAGVGAGVAVVVAVVVIATAADVVVRNSVKVAVDIGDMPVAYAPVCMVLDMVLAQLEGLDLLNILETVKLFCLNYLPVGSVNPDKRLVHWNHNYLDHGHSSRDFVWVEVVETLT
jgi:hypothetical protein